MNITTDHDKGQGMSELEMTKRIICDGCRVLEPWEHRCHGSRVMVDGERVAGSCDCPHCAEDQIR